MRPPLYIGVATAYEGASERQVSQVVRRHRLLGQNHFHTHNESNQRRRSFIADCVECGLLQAWVYIAPFPANEARKAIVRALVTDAAKSQAGRLVLEHADPARNQLDRREIERTLRHAEYDLAYSHDRPGTYAGLEIADAVAWAYGAGGMWRRQVTPIIEFVRDVCP